MKQAKIPKAVILAQGFFGSTNGKTAHGLVRYSKRYEVVGVIDSKFAGRDAGEVLDGRRRGIPLLSSLDEAIGLGAKVLIVGVATDGGYLPGSYRRYVKNAIENRMDIVSGLHEFLSDDREFAALARRNKVSITDVRKMFLGMQRFFTGDIEKVKAVKVAVLGTDSAIGKRTTAIMLVEKLNEMGHKAVFVGTGQTAWMQGAKYCALIDAMINDFVAGGIEGEVVRAWKDNRPDFIVVEGQGGIMHPAYPGGFEIIAAARPDAIILQCAPKRIFYDGFENYRIPDLEKFFGIMKLLSGKGPVGISLNTEKMKKSEVLGYVKSYRRRYGVPVSAPLYTGVDALASGLSALLARKGRGTKKTG